MSIDANGNELSVGDWVVHPFLSGSSTHLKFAMVKKESKNPEKVRLAGFYSQGPSIPLQWWHGYADSLYTMTAMKCLKIDKSQVPPHIVEAMGESWS